MGFSPTLLKQAATIKVSHEWYIFAVDVDKLRERQRKSFLAVDVDKLNVIYLLLHFSQVMNGLAGTNQIKNRSFLKRQTLYLLIHTNKRALSHNSRLISSSSSSSCADESFRRFQHKNKLIVFLLFFLLLLCCSSFFKQLH
jgi:hypothetical protein